MKAVAADGQQHRECGASDGGDSDGDGLPVVVLVVVGITSDR
jgi:hypothetical protein